MFLWFFEKLILEFRDSASYILEKLNSISTEKWYHFET